MHYQTQNKIRALRKSQKKGASLVIVVCVSAFLVAFALAMVYTAGLMLSQANRRIEQERCRQLAVSFARVLEKEILQYEKTENAPADSFYLFACRFLEDSRYMEYNPDYPESTVYLYSGGASRAVYVYVKITVVIFKENDWEGDRITGTLNYDPNETAQDPLSEVAVAHYTLTVEVIADTGKTSFHHATVYNQQANYDESAVLFEAEDGRKLKWESESRKWLVSNTGNEFEITTTTVINYEIQPHIDHLTGCKFSKTIQEAGDVTGGEAGNP